MLEEKDLISPCCNAPVTRSRDGFFYECTKCGIGRSWEKYFEEKIEKNKRDKENTEVNKRLKILEARVSYLESKLVKEENKKETDKETLLDLSEKIDWIYTELLRKKFENEDRR
jgi:hypothetical protein